MSTEQVEINRSAHHRVRRIFDRINNGLAQLPAYVILGGWSLFTIFVFLWICVTSLKTDRELFQNVWGLPVKLQFQNYINAWTQVKLRNLLSQQC